MKKKTILVACLATLGLAAVSCQKEPLVESQIINPENDAVYQMTYWVDEQQYSVTLHGDEELELFLQQLNVLAYTGHHVKISRTNTSRNSVTTKEVITFTTNSQEEINAWEKARLKEGYTVEVVYDPKTGIYTGTAFRED